MNNTLEKTKPQEPQKPLSRGQRRMIERIEKEAQSTHQRLISKFLDFMINCENPVSEQLNERAAEISAQWKMYCKTKRLNDNALDLVGNACSKAIKDFIEIKEMNLKEKDIGA